MRNPTSGDFTPLPRVSSSQVRASKNVDFIDSKGAPRTRLDKWRILAGEISPSALHCATVPDGPGCKWEGGSLERIEAENRRALKAARKDKATIKADLKAAEEAAISAGGYFSEPDWKEVISPDGVRCLVTRFEPKQQLRAAARLPADLSIPAFLQR